MGIRGLINRARIRARRADKAKTAEERSHERVQRAVTKIQLERAQDTLRAARIRRETEELQARLALEKARTAVNKAKAEQIKASGDKWKARYDRIGAITGLSSKPARKKAKAVGKSLVKAGKRLLTDKSKRKSVKRKKATKKR